MIRLKREVFGQKKKFSDGETYQKLSGNSCGGAARINEETQQECKKHSSRIWWSYLAANGGMLGYSLLVYILMASFHDPMFPIRCNAFNLTTLMEITTEDSKVWLNSSSSNNETSSLSMALKQQNISQLLDGLLKGYDHHIRPDIGGSPTVVFVDIEVRSMGPISDGDMTYAMDCYFRQSWKDRRLSFKGAMPSLALSNSMLEKIWKPDTHFFNGKHSYLHTITTPNQFVRLGQDGTVLYSSRLTIQANCPMNLENFPMDMQRCPLKIGSFGYVKTDVIYHWNPKRRVVIASDMKLSQFDMISTPSGNTTETWNKGSVSVLLVSFHLQRHMGYFLIEVYAPCTLLVVLSWVSFWINREATADRVSLGVMTVLTMTFLGLEKRNDLPKVPYCTALDFFVAFSFVFIFATIAEFAAVHYYTKVGSGEFYFPQSSSSSSNCSSSEEDDENDDLFQNEESDMDGGAGTPNNTENSLKFSMASEEAPSLHFKSLGRGNCVHSVSFHESRNGRPPAPSVLESNAGSGGPHLGGVGAARVVQRSLRRPSNQRGAGERRVKKRKQTKHFSQSECRLNSVSKIDKVSRIIFPVVFIAMHFIYWNIYLNRDT